VSSKISKESLKGPDAFVSITDRIFGWTENHFKLIASALLGVFVLAIGYVGYTMISARQEAKASEALYLPEAELKKAETQLREARAKQMQDLAGLNPKGKNLAKPQSAPAADYAKDYNASVERLKSEIKNHASSRAALVSALSLTSFLIQQNQFEKALEVIELPRFRPSENDMLGGFLNMHRGLVYLENKKYDDAVKAYEGVVKSSSLKYFHPEAMLKLGVTFELKGDPTKAREVYEKISREFPASDASKSAQQYIRLLESKTQQG